MGPETLLRVVVPPPLPVPEMVVVARESPPPEPQAMAIRPMASMSHGLNQLCPRKEAVFDVDLGFFIGFNSLLVIVNPQGDAVAPRSKNFFVLVAVDFVELLGHVLEHGPTFATTGVTQLFEDFFGEIVAANAEL